jgi:hypothetical protein
MARAERSRDPKSLGACETCTNIHVACLPHCFAVCFPCSTSTAHPRANASPEIAMRNSRNRKLSLGLSAAIIFLTSFMTAPRAPSQTARVLHSFGSNTKAGLAPASNLIFDSAGNLYGTTIEGGTDNVGTVFELKPTPGGPWTEVLLHSFAESGHDGQSPYAGLIFDSAGNLYGTTNAGGIGSGGIVFELSPPVPPSTRWT